MPPNRQPFYILQNAILWSNIPYDTEIMTYQLISRIIKCSFPYHRKPLTRSSTNNKVDFAFIVPSIEVTNKNDEVRTLPVNGLFVAVGRIPENQNFASVIELDASGYAVASENCRTKTPGVFVAGDNRTKDVRQLVTAAADGAVAATEAVKYINE